MARISSLPSSSCNPFSVFSSGDDASTLRRQLNPTSTSSLTLASPISCSGRFIWQRSGCRNQNAGNRYSEHDKEPLSLAVELSATGRREAMVEMTVAALTIPAMVSNVAVPEKVPRLYLYSFLACQGYRVEDYHHKL